MITWLRTLLGMGPVRDVRAEVLARPVVHPPPPPYRRILGMDKPHLCVVYDVQTASRLWMASCGPYGAYSETPKGAYLSVVRMCMMRE